MPRAAAPTARCVFRLSAVVRWPAPGGTVMPRNSVDYEEEFYAWTVEQSRLLRSGELSAIDVANIAEEIESIGRCDRRELGSRLVALAMHLLKWLNQPGARSRSWSATIDDEQRLQ